MKTDRDKLLDIINKRLDMLRKYKDYDRYGGPYDLLKDLKEHLELYSNKIEYFTVLSEYLAQHFELWWPLLKKDDRRSDHNWTCIEKCYDYFDVWWPYVKDNPYVYVRNKLYRYCEEHFDKWFDSEKCRDKWYLIIYYQWRHFNKWKKYIDDIYDTTDKKEIQWIIRYFILRYDKYKKYRDIWFKPEKLLDCDTYVIFHEILRNCPEDSFWFIEKMNNRIMWDMLPLSYFRKVDKSIFEKFWSMYKNRFINCTRVVYSLISLGNEYIDVWIPDFKQYIKKEHYRTISAECPKLFDYITLSEEDYERYIPIKYCIRNLKHKIKEWYDLAKSKMMFLSNSDYIEFIRLSLESDLMEVDEAIRKITCRFYYKISENLDEICDKLPEDVCRILKIRYVQKALRL